MVVSTRWSSVWAAHNIADRLELIPSAHAEIIALQCERVARVENYRLVGSDAVLYGGAVFDVSRVRRSTLGSIVLCLVLAIRRCRRWLVCRRYGIAARVLNHRFEVRERCAGR